MFKNVSTVKKIIVGLMVESTNDDQIKIVFLEVKKM